MLNKSIAGTSQREFIDKKIWFREADTLEDPSSISEAENDYYMYISATPDSFYPMNKKYVRGDIVVGMSKFGKRKDGPGCYYKTVI